MEMEETYLPYHYNDTAEKGQIGKHHVPHTYIGFKRLLDIIFSSLGIVLMSPFLLILCAAIRLTSPGPAIYVQKRVGKRGKLFAIYKFRTMVDGADRLSEHLTPELIRYYQVNRKLENDPRITKIGGFLRKTSLDELPQLFNILIGNMSIVGPRPMLPDEIGMYGENYRNYITVKPGLTGLWQIKSRSETKMSERATLDHEYICRAGIGYDLLIIAKTFRVVLSKKGAC